MELLRTTEWVNNHDEAHGQLLVRGESLGGMIDCACASVARRFPYGRLHLLRVGWWTAAPCHCRRTMAASNHPSWHYRPAHRGDCGAWYGAEVRVEVRRES